MSAAHRCLNCQTDLEGAGPARFCPHCGQRTDTMRLTVFDVARDLLQTFVNVERGPLTFARALATGPGLVAREYVDGKRRRHYGPFATLAVLVGITALLINLFDFHLLVHDGLPARLAEPLRHHFNLLLLLQLPLLGAICAVAFLDAGFSLPEHLVLVAYTFSVRAAVVALLAVGSYVAKASEPQPWQTTVYWAAWYAYFGWAASQFYPGPRLWSWARGAAAAALGHIAIVALLVGVDAVYEAAFGA